MCGSGENVKRCGGCKVARYCSVKCQKSHRSYHEQYCGYIPELVKLEMDKLYGDKKDHRVQQVQYDGAGRW